MFFFGVKKERKNLWGDASPKPRRPWRSGARPCHPEMPLQRTAQSKDLVDMVVGSTKNNRQKGFVKFWHKTFSFVFLFFVLHETKRICQE